MPSVEYPSYSPEQVHTETEAAASPEVVAAPVVPSATALPGVTPVTPQVTEVPVPESLALSQLPKAPILEESFRNLTRKFSQSLSSAFDFDQQMEVARNNHEGQ